MNKMIFKLDGVTVDPPLNWAEVSFKYEWTNGRPVPDQRMPVFEFVTTNARNLNEWLERGNSGGLGILAMPPLEIALPCSVESPTLFRGFLNLAAEEATFKCDLVTAPALAAEDIDSFADRANGFSFALLYDQGIITRQDFVRVDYVLNRVPDYEKAAILTVTTFLLSYQIINIIKDIGDIGGDAAGVFNLGGAVAKIIVMIAYIALLVVILYTFIKTLIEVLFPLPKSYHGMRIKTLFERGCQHMGYTLNAPMFNDDLLANLVILPAKFREGTKPGRASSDVGFPEQTFGQFIDQMVTLFNARVMIKNNVLHFDRKDRLHQFSGYYLKALSDSTVRTNASELQSNYLLSFQNDSDDHNTTVNPDGRICQVTESLASFSDRRQSALKGLVEIEFPFARGVRKTSETTLEKVFRTIHNTYGEFTGKVGDVINTIKRIVKKIPVAKRPSLALLEAITPQQLEPIRSYIGYLQLDADFFTVNKLLVVDPRSPGKLHRDNDRLTARYFWDHFYCIESALPSDNRPEGNQWLRYQVEIPICCEDFVRIINAGLIFVEPLNRQAQMEELEYKPVEGMARMTFRINKTYTSNINQKIQ